MQILVVPLRTGSRLRPAMSAPGTALIRKPAGKRRLFAGMALLFAALLPQMATAQTAGQGKVFRAGASVSNITPPLGSGIVGNFGNPPSAAHIHDQLHARSLVLDDGETKLVMVTVDNIGATRDVFDEAKRLIHEKIGLPKERMMMSSTHTHSAVSARGQGPRQGRFDRPLDEYQVFLARRIADGVRIALNNLAPARIGWGAGRVPQHVFNRRWRMKPGTPLLNPYGGQDQALMNPPYADPNLLEPAGPTDPEVSFLAVQSPDGRPIALLANYSVHYVGGIPKDHISADYFGVFADRMQELLGADRRDPAFVAIMSNGTSGDVTSTDRGRPKKDMPPYAKMRLVADDLAQEVLRVYKATRFHDWVQLRSAYTELTLRVRKPDAAMLAYTRKVLEKPETEKPAHPLEKAYAWRPLAFQNEWPETIDVPLQVFRIGELGIAAIPFEVFAETGLDIKARSPFKSTFTIELANGNLVYLPTPKQHKLGGYETWLGTSRVEVDASTKITDRILALFAGLR